MGISLPTSNTNENKMEELKIKFGGDTHEIEANTYINSLLHFTNIVQEVNKGISKDKKIEVKIRANVAGSFIVDLMIMPSDIIDGVKQIFSSEHITYASELIKTVSEVYKVAKHLFGKKPKNITNDKDESIRIENFEGTVQVFDFRGANIYLNNPNIKEAIAQEFETLESDKNVTSFELLNKNEEPLIEINQKEFYDLSSSGSTEELTKNERIETVSNANLNISSLDWEFKKKWDFYYLGNKISAKVTDSTFGERIDKGERFGKGDTLNAEMEITQKFDESVNSYVNKSYTITKILKHIERPTQSKLDLSN